MAQQKGTKTLWSKSFPTTASTQSALYTCTFEVCKRGGFSFRDRVKYPCNKIFSRECDLRHHQKNHTRPFKCEKCNQGFPSPKDLKRHANSRHDQLIRYLCCVKECKESSKFLEGYRPTLRNPLHGFIRKDDWQKHMRERHNTSREAMQEIQKNGIPTAVWKGKPAVEYFLGVPVPKGNWVLAIPVDSATTSPEILLPRHTNTPATESSKGVDPVIELLAEKAKTDPGLKRLMGRVANREETPEELKLLHKHIDELKAAANS